jgi:protein-disulfide isomerase
MTQEAKVIIGISAVTIIILIVAVFFFSGSQKQEAEPVEKVTDTKQLLGDQKRIVKAPDAKVTIVEFGDFQCPACGSAHPTVKQVLKDYEGKVTFVWRHFPLPMHKNAMLAAIASEAAADQGKFWEMHTLLFDNQKDWGESNNAKETFVSYAEKLGLDTAKFTDALDKKFNAERIQSDQDAGIALGVNSTPTFFINGEKENGVLSYDEFKQKIDPLLK